MTISTNSVAIRVAAKANDDAARAPVGSVKPAALAACAVGLLLLVIQWAAISPDIYSPWLLAWWFWAGIPIGCLGVSLIHTLTHGRWGFAILPARHAALKTLIAVAFLFLPVILGRTYIYGWAQELAGESHHVPHHEEPAADPAEAANADAGAAEAGAAVPAAMFVALPQESTAADHATEDSGLVDPLPGEAELGVAHEGEHHAAARLQYLSSPWFEARAVGFLVLWCLFGLWLSRRHYRTGQFLPAIRIGAIGLILFVFTLTFATVDWVMSLDQNWYSTIAGANTVAANLVQGLSFAVLASFVWSRRSASVVAAEAATDTPATYDAQSIRDLSNLLLASICVHMWFVFSEFLIIWSGDQPNEAAWYLRRIQNGWLIVCWAWLALGFILPFMLILSEGVKRNPPRLALVAGLMLTGHALKSIWTVAPDLHFAGGWSWLGYVGAWLLMGGLWCLLFARNYHRVGISTQTAEVTA